MACDEINSKVDHIASTQRFHILLIVLELVSSAKIGIAFIVCVGVLHGILNRAGLV